MAEGMQYTVKTMKVVNKGALRAFVDVIFNGVWVIKGFKVLETAKDGGVPELWISRPSEKSGEKWYDTVYPVAEGEMEVLSKIVLDEYRNRLGE
jgi:DNA-binding cell septation regulator SpoVG